VPAALRDDHEIAGAQRSDQLFALLANCQLGAARKHMQELIARVKLPRRPPNEARDATGAAVEIKRLDLASRLLGDLDVIMKQLARLPTRRELAQTGLLATLTGAALARIFHRPSRTGYRQAPNYAEIPLG
jgi:hypothetical protein